MRKRKKRREVEGQEQEQEEERRHDQPGRRNRKEQKGTESKIETRCRAQFWYV